jgi:hypothetical protein
MDKKLAVLTMMTNIVHISLNAKSFSLRHQMKIKNFPS